MCSWEKLRTPDLRQQPILGIKEIQPFESHQWERLSRGKSILLPSLESNCNFRTRFRSTLENIF